MARFFGIVGYGTPSELVDGVWSDGITERSYKGDILNETISSVPGENVNDDLRLSQRVSIVADAFSLENSSSIKFVDWVGSCWVVNSVQIERPRLILSLGGVYHGPRAEAPIP